MNFIEIFGILDFNKLSRGIHSILIIMLLAVLSVSAQTATTPFKIRYSAEQHGSVLFLSNNSLTGQNCPGENEIPPAGTSHNNNYKSKFIDIDNFSETFNSSTANLKLPECSSITFAGLYWQGVVSSSNPRTKEKNKVKLKLPDAASYIELSADASFGGGQYFKDITTLINSQTSSNGTYTVADLVCDENAENVEAGWTIVIAYRQESLQLRNITIFDGLISMPTNSTTTFDLSGFSTPANGPVNFALGFVGYDGDRVKNSDCITFNGKKIFDAAHDSTDVFNSSITDNGKVVTTRNPAYNNTLGYDASIIYPDNTNYSYLKNSQHSAKIGLTALNEGYSVGVLCTAIDIYNPYFQFSHSYINLTDPSSQTVRAGQSLQFAYDVRNTGNDKSNNTLFTDTIPALLDYIPGSLELEYENGVHQKLSDGKADDQGEYDAATKTITVRLGNGAGTALGGSLQPGEPVHILYKTRMTTDCDHIACSPAPVSKTASLSFSGNVNAEMNWKIKSAPISSAYCTAQGPLVITPELCAAKKDTTLTVCYGTTPASIALPAGYELYSPGDTEFTHSPEIITTAGKYTARHVLSTGCTFSYGVNITVTPLSACGQKTTPGNPNAISYPTTPKPEEEKPGYGLYVPTAFTPSSSISELTHLTVKGIGLAKWHMAITNKWGQVIWETNKINPDGSPGEAWDGTYAGQEAMSGCYLWAITATFADGTEWEGNRIRSSVPKKAGIVYLIR